MEFAAAALSRLRAVLSKQRDAAVCVLTAACGFVTSASPILSAASPFGLAFAGAVSAPHALWATAGAVAGYLTQTDPAHSLRYLASLVLLLGLRWAFAFADPDRLALYTPLLAALCAAVTGFAVAWSGGDAAYGWAMALCETAICAAAGILFSRALRGAFDGAPFSGTTGVCMGVLLCVLLTGAARILGGSFSPAYWAALWGILLFAQYGRAGQAVVIGAAAGIAAALSGSAGLRPVLTAVSLAAQAFSPLGRSGTWIAAAVSGVLALLSQGMTYAAAPFLIGTAAAGAAFFLTPFSFLQAAGLVPSPDRTQSEALRELTSFSLERTRAALSQIAQMTQEVSEKLEIMRCDRAQTLIDRTCEEVCRGCPRNTNCWQLQYDTTAEVCADLFFGRCEELPPQFSCSRFETLRARLRAAAAEYAAHRALREQAAGLRSVTCEQFSGMSLLIDSLAKTLSSFSCADESVSLAANELLVSLGAEPSLVSCYFGQNGRPQILAKLPRRKVARLDPEKTAAALSEMIRRPLAPARLLSGEEEEACLLWEEKAPFRAESCFRQKTAQGALCGDCCSAFDAGEGSFLLLLSDGMGVGRPAALDAALTVSLLERLLSAGADFDAALCISNAALLSRGEERLCTVDAALIDLYSMTLTCCKAGAAPSFLCREGRVRRIGDSGLPVGILGEAQAKRTSLSLREGDLIVLVSDGLTDQSDEWLPSQITAYAAGPIEELCENLLKTAQLRRAGGRADDCTVLAARIVKNPDVL